MNPVKNASEYCLFSGEFRPEIRTTSAPADLNIPLPVQHRYETDRDLIPHRKVFFRLRPVGARFAGIERQRLFPFTNRAIKSRIAFRKSHIGISAMS